jgi:electron transfer flavoprotein-quinone oxidoreductase
VYTDFRRFRYTPSFVNSERLQNLYPDIVAHGAETLFRVDGKSKQKIVPLAMRTVRRFRIRPHHLLRDFYHAARAYLL